jgi:hypothetical protein
MNDTALMLRDDASLSLTFTPQAARLKAAALELSAQIGKVVDAAGNARAVAAQTELAALIKLVEEARVAAKDPVLQFGRNIDAAAKAFTEELKAEAWRVSQIVGEYQQAEAARATSAINAAKDRLNQIDKDRMAELATAPDLDAMDAINQKYHAMMCSFNPMPIAPAKVESQRVTSVWEFEVFDVHALARAHPGCVKIEPRALEIKSALNAGVKLAGVRGWKTTKATVQLPRAKKPIEA